ncbi:FkbM family methyltransferase [Mesorhizobium sp. M0898]|uniref:FkbM family methyltransferase n=1 Tax=Mesorhizobium sp. M0898 TaxID=2957020 RepID=UPI00333AB26D
MRRSIRNAVGKFLARYDVAITRRSSLHALRENEKCSFDLQFVREMNPESRSEIVELLRESKSQLRQDLFVLSELDFKKNGFFVEFGATDGVSLSNTFLLEKEFLWNGIVAEPARVWHDALSKNRGVNVETKCVWENSSSALTFNEVRYSELSTIASFSGSDGRAREREVGKTYTVDTISLLDLLRKYKAPFEVDYLSIDTEGSELKILEAFDFDLYNIKVITCEHNYTPMRERIFALLTRVGYERKHEKISKFDDWYVRK